MLNNPAPIDPSLPEDVRDYPAAIVETLREPLLVLDADLRVKTASHAFYRTFKVTPEETEGQLIYQLGNGGWNIPALRKLLQEILPTDGQFKGYHVEHDFPVIGRRIMVLNARQLQDDNQIKLILLAFEDITERRAAEALLKTSEIRYRRLFEAAHDGILILDAKTYKILDANPFVLELLDYPLDFLVGKELWEIGVFKDKGASESAIQKLHKEGSIRYENLPLQDRNGRRRPVEVVANLYREDLEPVIQCNIRDSSLRERFDDDRRILLAGEQAARLEAEAANRAKDIFLATLSHELRTPLNAILGWAGILRQPNCSAEDVAEGVEVIERNCRMQAQLIEDVLDIARIVSGKLRLEIQPCDIAATITAAIKVVRASADAKRINLDVDLDLSLKPTPCDCARIQQVVWNLLANAVKFTPKGGTITVTLVQVRSSIRITVADTGQGISSEFLPYIFERFRQADGSTRRKFGGLGLGLSIARQLVELHGGTVQAQSKGEGLGATFVVELPISAVEAPVAAGSSNDAKLPPVRLNGIRVLFVDDEADARRLVSKVLGEAGAVVVLAGTVREALKMLAQLTDNGQCPDLLISDLAMPEQDGFDLIREVRRLGHTVRQLPAVALTASVNKEFIRQTLMGGFQVHLPKPVNSLDLIALVASLTGRTGALPDAATDLT